VRIRCTFVGSKNTDTMKSAESKVTIKGITYVIEAEQSLPENAMKNQSHYTTLLHLRRPNGHIVFWAMRDVNGVITLN
jgi:hypothetical protein